MTVRIRKVVLVKDTQDFQITSIPAHRLNSLFLQFGVETIAVPDGRYVKAYDRHEFQAIIRRRNAGDLSGRDSPYQKK